MDVPDRKSFVIYKNFYEPIKHLSDDDLGKLFRAIFQYQIDGESKFDLAYRNVDPDIKIPFEFFKNQFNLDNEKWLKRAQSSRENGSLGGRPQEPRKPSGLSGLDEEPRKPDTVTDTVTVNVTDTENETEKDLKESKKKSFDEWWISWRTKARKNPGVKNKAEKHYRELHKKLSAEEIQKATDLHFEASGKFHKSAERFLNPNNGIVQQLLEDPPKPKLSAKPNRIPPKEPDLKNHRTLVRKELSYIKTREDAADYYESLGDYLKVDPEVQQMFERFM